MPDDTTAPVTAEDLRERTAQAIRDANGTPEALAWWRQHPVLAPAHIYAEAVLAALAGDPGDLPARMADALVAADAEWTVSREVEWKDFLAAAALSVRWEYAARQAAEVERLRTALAATRSDVDAMQREVHRHVLANAEAQGEVERLRAELEFQEHHFAQLGELYVHACRGASERKGLRQRAEQAEAERDLLRETLAESDLGAQVLAQWEALAAADADRDRLEAERDRYRLAWQSARGRAKAYGESMTRLSGAWGSTEAEVERLRAELAEAKRHRTQAENRASLYRQQAADEHERAEQAEQLLRVAHETSNRSEAERARAVAKRDALQAAIAEAELIGFAHWKTMHQRPVPRGCHACEIGMVLSRHRPRKRDSREEVETRLAALDAPETPDAPDCPRCGGSMVEPGTEEEGDWDSAAMRHHPYTGEPCTACNGSGKATGWLDQLAAGSLAAAREKFDPIFAPETPGPAPTERED